jgi:hypothetical protein
VEIRLLSTSPPLAMQLHGSPEAVSSTCFL